MTIDSREKSKSRLSRRRRSHRDLQPWLTAHIELEILLALSDKRLSTLFLNEIILIHISDKINDKIVNNSKLSWVKEIQFRASLHFCTLSKLVLFRIHLTLINLAILLSY